jgi:chemotaxis protein CheD
MSTETGTDLKTAVIVPMADLAVSQQPDDVLSSNPLGACLGIAIFDPNAHVGGILHSLLPASSIDPLRAATRPGMFLDTGFAALLDRAAKLGAKKENLQIFVAGGSQIMDETAHFNIGKRNYEAFMDILTQSKLQITAEDVGGYSNRTLLLSLATGEVRLRMSGQAKLKVLCKQ